jgi:hypothetical protein
MPRITSCGCAIAQREGSGRSVFLEAHALLDEYTDLESDGQFFKSGVSGHRAAGGQAESRGKPGTL